MNEHDKALQVKKDLVRKKIISLRGNLAVSNVRWLLEDISNILDDMVDLIDCDQKSMDKILFKKIAQEVEQSFGMGGLSEGLYYDFALECARRYAEIKKADN